MKKILIIAFCMFLVSCWNQNTPIIDDTGNPSTPGTTVIENSDEDTSDENDVDDQGEVSQEQNTTNFFVTYLSWEDAMSVEAHLWESTLNISWEVAFESNQVVITYKATGEHITLPLSNHLDKSFLVQLTPVDAWVQDGVNYYNIKAYKDTTILSEADITVEIPQGHFSSSNETSPGGEDEFWEEEIKDDIPQTGDDMIPNDLYETHPQDQRETNLDGTVSRPLWDEYDSIVLNFPTKPDSYGNPIMLGNDAFTYSNIPNFEAKKIPWIDTLSCETIWDYLKQNYNWYYWNTCRPLWNNIFYVNVLSLKWEQYFYERQYFDGTYNIFAKVLLEDGDWLKGEDLAEKNTQLKEIDFEVTHISDQLIQDIFK